MKNREIAKILFDLAAFLEMDKVPFKPYAYEKAALALEAMEEDVESVYLKGGLKALEEIPGVGKSIAQKIEEYLKTGRIKYYEAFKKKLPINLDEIIAVEGMGPKKAKTLYQKLGVKSVADLEKAAKSHKIAGLFGFGPKTEKNILEGIEFLKRSKGRFLLGEILPKVKEIEGKLKNLKSVSQVYAAGSIRRMKETIGDADFLVVSEHPQEVMDFFVSIEGVVKIWGKGKTKTSVRLKEGFDMDIRVVPKISLGSALLYFTGSKEHNIHLRKLAIDKGLKLSEYGLFRGAEMVAGRSEESIYKALGLDWMPPELREDKGEIEAAASHTLPDLVRLSDIKGDLHCHSDWDGGVNSITEMAQAGRNLGYQYLGISDHTKFLKIEHGLDEKGLEKRNREIDKINGRLKNFTILKGAEANILGNGAIDIRDESLAKLDFVIAGIHSQFKMEKAEMTERMIRAMKNPNIDVISHPTGRILKRRDEYQIDFEKILRAAKEKGKILEINSFPERLDLNDLNIRMAKEFGVKMAINTDSHHRQQLRFMELGVSQARRGWAEKKDIINSFPLEKLLEFFKKNKK